jgi:hypothetical protein
MSKVTKHYSVVSSTRLERTQEDELNDIFFDTMECYIFMKKINLLSSVD